MHPDVTKYLCPCCRGRHASSGYEVLEPLADGGAARLRWRLRTGRTHQIRVHARHLGHALLGDAAYGGAAGSAVTTIARGNPERCAPGLHAKLDACRLRACTTGYCCPWAECCGYRQRFLIYIAAPQIILLAMSYEMCGNRGNSELAVFTCPAEAADMHALTLGLTHQRGLLRVCGPPPQAGGGGARAGGAAAAGAARADAGL